MQKLLALTLAALVASACASSGLERSKGEQILERYDGYIGEPVRGFTAFRQQSWRPVSRNQLILWTSINDAYLLTIAGSCPDLLHTNAVSVTSTTSEISTLDRVMVRGDSCPIRQIQPIDVREHPDGAGSYIRTYCG
ncbi:MAG: DUF6491 family protein, partial [Steroidobacteraceae bacterium]